MVKVGKIELKIGHFAGKYQILVNVQRQILHINVK